MSGCLECSGGDWGWLGIWLSDSARKFLKAKGFIFFLFKGLQQSINKYTFVCTALNHYQRRLKAPCTVRERKN